MLILILVFCEKKVKNYFVINMGIHTMIIYFALSLLINGYKKYLFS